MNPIHTRSQTALVVLSCDKYSDLWPHFFDLLFQFWPDCPYTVYLSANEKTFSHPKVTTLLSGEDRDWSSSLRACIEPLTEDSVFLLLDDTLISGPVLASSIYEKVDLFRKSDWDYLRFRPSPRPRELVSEGIGRLSRDSLYRTSVFSALWKKSSLLSILKDGESPWEFELQGTERSRSYKHFYSTTKLHFPYIHGVQRGKWLRPALRKLRKLGRTVDLTKRPAMSRWEMLVHWLASIKGPILHSFPYRMQPMLMKLSRQLRKLGSNA